MVAGHQLNRMGEAELARFRRDRIGFVFQFFHLLPNLTVIENLLMPAQLAGRRGSVESARELLVRLEIADVGDRYPAKLSGGQQQRVAMGRALINQPALLLAGEPTGALDTRSGERVMNLLAEINREGQTVLLVTHDPKLATRYASRVISIVDGLVEDDVTLVTTQRRTEEVMKVCADEGVSS
jgi:putative ABC transport system ATP-binding protein